MQVGSISNPVDVQHAVGVISDRGYVGLQYHGVFILVFSGTDGSARMCALAAKRDADVDKPLSILSSASHVLPLVDRERIRNNVASRLLEDLDLFKRTFGAICHVRLPLIQQVIGREFPIHSVSFTDDTPYVQLLDPFGNPGFSKLVHELELVGTEFLNATSMNLRGESEITEVAAAEVFCSAANTPLLLLDPLYLARDVVGSFPAVDLERLVAVREGHIPLSLIDRIAGLEFDRSDASAHRHPHSEYLLGLINHIELREQELREQILNYFYRDE